jgi:O-antigen/teichoic acid export membrane protein
VPVAVAATVYAREILRIVGGRPEYLAAVPALEWLAWSFPCFTVLAILYNALYAARRAGDVAAILGVTLVFNVGLNLLLIPRYSFFASAALTTASEALNVALAICAVRRHVGPLAAWPVAARVALAALAMALVTWALRPLGPAAGLPAGVLTYLAAIRLLRTLGAPERAILARVPLAGRYARWL